MLALIEDVASHYRLMVLNRPSGNGTPRFQWNRGILDKTSLEVSCTSADSQEPTLFFFSLAH